MLKSTLILALIGFTFSNGAPKKINMYPELENYINRVEKNIESISERRKNDLNEMSAYIQSKIDNGEKAKLTFICTHNSRRSHMSQIWAATAAAQYGIEGSIECYSGGTEATAFNPRAVSSIERAGFTVENPGGDNPRYTLKYASDGPEMYCWSKIFEDEANPSSSFGAVMTCSHADEACPIVPGAEARFSIPYEDPKVADGTPEEASKYDERCFQIATEMFYVFSQIKS